MAGRNRKKSVCVCVFVSVRTEALYSDGSHLIYIAAYIKTDDIQAK